MGLSNIFSRKPSAEDLFGEAEQCYRNKDYATAVKLYGQAYALDPDVGDFVSYSMCLHEGRGTGKDDKRFFEVTRHEAMKRESKYAANNLANCYYQGVGCAKDESEAVTWFNNARCMGHLGATLSLAFIYHRRGADDHTAQYMCYACLEECVRCGYGKSAELMAQWFGPLTAEEQQGLSVADIYRRGRHWLDGTGGCTPCRPLAERWIRCAVERGCTEAYGAMADCIEQTDRYAERNMWLMKGADMGNVDCMVKLARNIHEGVGWPQDEAGARRFLLMACEAGSGEARRLYDDWFPTPEAAAACEEAFLKEIEDYEMALDADDTDRARTIIERLRSERGRHGDFELVLHACFCADYFSDSHSDSMHRAHDLLMCLNDDYDIPDNCRETAERHLSVLFEDFYDEYETLGVGTFCKAHERAWYGRRAYHYYSAMAARGNIYSMYTMAVYLLDHLDIVARDVPRAVGLLLRAKDHYPHALYKLGCIYMVKEYGFCDSEKALPYFKEFVDNSTTFGETECFACYYLGCAYLLRKTFADDIMAWNYVSRAYNSGLGDSDLVALYGYMLALGKGCTGHYDKGLALVCQAHNDGSDIAYDLMVELGATD